MDFFRILGSLKMKFSQILVQRMENISDLFLALSLYYFTILIKCQYYAIC